MNNLSDPKQKESLVLQLAMILEVTLTMKQGWV